MPPEVDALRLGGDRTHAFGLLSCYLEGVGVRQGHVGRRSGRWSCGLWTEGCA